MWGSDEFWRFWRQDEGSLEEGSKVVGSNHNTLKEGPNKTHFYPQQRSSLVWKEQESEKNGEYGAVEVEPYSLWKRECMGNHSGYYIHSVS